jgi:hypothetical protein
VSRLDQLAQFAESRTSESQTPKVRTALLWELLDYALSSSPADDSCDTSDNVELNVNTQYLQPVDSDAPPRSETTAQPMTNLNAFDSNIWDNTMFEFDMSDFSNMPGLSAMGLPNDAWMSGHL